MASSFLNCSECGHALRLGDSHCPSCDTAVPLINVLLVYFLFGVLSLFVTAIAIMLFGT